MTERTEFPHGALVEGAADTSAEVAPEPVTAGGQVFPSQWHLDAYVAGVKRELANAEARLKVGATRLSKERRSEYEEQKRVALSELERLGERP